MSLQCGGFGGCWRRWKDRSLSEAEGVEFDSAGSTATKAKSIKGEVQFQTGETSHELSCKITQLVNLGSRFHSVHQNFGSQELHFLTLVVKLFPVSTHQNEPRRQDHGHMLCPDGHPRTHYNTLTV